MTEIDYSAMILLAEIAIFLAVVAGAVSYVLIRRRRKKQKMVKNFILEFKTENDSRTANVTDILREFRKYDEVIAAEMANVIRQHEKNLYKNVLNMLLDSNKVDMETIDKSVKLLMNSCLEVQNSEQYEREIREIAEANAAKGVELEAGQIIVEEKEMDRLQDRNKKLYQENERINAELKNAMETMEEVMKEYTAMYAGQNPKMESLSQKVDKIKEKMSD